MHAQSGQAKARTNSKGLSLGGGALDKKPHLVKWQIVCFDKMNGVWG